MVLIWPDNLARLSLNPADINAAGKRLSAASDVIVGWTEDDHFSSPTVVIGVIVSFDSSKSHQELKKEVNSAIKSLSESQHPCCSRCHPTAECFNCSTYKYLSVIATSNEHNDSNKKTQKHKEIIIYNPREAYDWYSQYNQFKRQYNDVGALQRNLIRMSKSSLVFEELASVLNHNKTIQQQQEQQQQQQQQQQRLDTITPIRKSNRKLSKPTKVEYRDYFWGQSLLLLHWNAAIENSNSDKFFGKQISLFRALAPIWNEQRCSTSSAALILDFLLGMLIGFFFFRYPSTIIQCIGHIRTYHDQLFYNSLKWLESFPAGFKLNVALTHRIGREVRLILFYHKRFYSSVVAATATIFGDSVSSEQITGIFLKKIGLFTAFFGSRFFFAMMFDITRLSSLHINFLSGVFAKCLRCEMSALKSLWLLFTGKKRNVLRQRSDHLHYDHMQLLLGMILFSTCLFVFTTVLVYHWFFAVTDIGATLVCGISWLLYISVEGGVQCEKIISRRRLCRNNDSWKGNEVHFAPASLSESISKMDVSYVMRFHSETLESKELHSNNLLPNVLIEYQEACVLKVTFPFESDFSIAFDAFVLFIVSLIYRFPTLLKRLLLGSHFNLAHSFIDFTNLLIKDKK